MAIYTRSLLDGDFSVTKNVRIAGNYMWNTGYPNHELEHTIYTESEGIVIEFNHFGKLRANATGNSLKDRSAGTVIRYNYLEDGAHSMDLVEAEDFSAVALADPAYRTTLVYGNLISKAGDSGSYIHYGGDHIGSEANFRKGTLYFFNNTILASGTSAWLFQLSTTQETAEVWNNVFYFPTSVTSIAWRQQSDVAAGYTGGGVLNLGKNWINTGWGDGDIYHPVNSFFNGSANLITGTTAPFDVTTFIPTGSAIVDVGQANVAGAATIPVTYQMSVTGVASARTVKGTAIDLGAVEK
jgi:hypothetical protein